MQIEKGYEKLAAVFQAAHDQAAHGKGKERHANGLPFHEQRMQSISKTLASADGMAYQVVKKMTEGLQLDDHKRREKELLGAINYLAGIVIYFREASDSKYAKEDGNWPESAESRLLPIMQNGNDGEHYRGKPQRSDMLAADNLKSGDWWCADTSETARQAFELRGFNVADQWELEDLDGCRLTGKDSVTRFKGMSKTKDLREIALVDGEFYYCKAQPPGDE